MGFSHWPSDPSVCRHRPFPQCSALYFTQNSGKIERRCRPNPKLQGLCKKAAFSNCRCRRLGVGESVLLSPSPTHKLNENYVLALVLLMLLPSQQNRSGHV